jgi:hypothetical protein
LSICYTSRGSIRFTGSAVYSILVCACFSVRMTRSHGQRPGGVGIHMAKQLVDDISYFRDNGCNQVVLTKPCGGAVRPEEK